MSRTNSILEGERSGQGWAVITGKRIDKKEAPMTKTSLWLLGLAMMAGCASGPPMGRDKAGATYEEFAHTRYTCMKEATGRYAGAAVNAYGGSSASQPAISCQMYDACMQSRGFYAVPNGRFQMPINCLR